MTQKIFCVTHEQPLVPEHLFDYAIGLGAYHPSRGAHIAQLNPYWDSMRAYAYGAAGNYVIPQAVARQSPPPHLTGIFSHRKVVSNRVCGIEAPNYAVYREIDVETAASITVDDVRPTHGHDFLIGPLVTIPHGIVYQYAEKHHVTDLYEYLLIAVELKILTSADVRAFTLSTAFIPGGCELGIYPTAWLCETLKKLEAVGRVFVSKNKQRLTRYDSYQVRAVGFLAERLGSFLLLQEIRRRYGTRLPRSLFGSLCAIVPKGDSYQRAVAV